MEEGGLFSKRLLLSLLSQCTLNRLLLSIFSRLELEINFRTQIYHKNIGNTGDNDDSEFYNVGEIIIFFV
jgi:hypothetical protein